MNVMHYRGYAARIDFDKQDEIFIGHIVGVMDIVGFHSESVSGLKAAFHEAVDDYLETCAKAGKEPRKPHSGKVMLRVKPETHRKAATAAEPAGKSLNQWAADILEAATRPLGTS